MDTTFPQGWTGGSSWKGPGPQQWWEALVVGLHPGDQAENVGWDD